MPMNRYLRKFAIPTKTIISSVSRRQRVAVKVIIRQVMSIMAQVARLFVSVIAINGAILPPKGTKPRLMTAIGQNANVNRNVGKRLNFGKTVLSRG